MKTIQELYIEVMADQELKEKFIEAANAGKTEEFLKEHGCEATMEELNAFLKAKAEEDAPLSMDELDNAAGGDCATAKEEICMSLITFGVKCVIEAVKSAKKGMTEEACQFV